MGRDHGHLGRRHHGRRSIKCATNGEENLFPDTVWLGLDAYGALAGLVDGAGRPLFPYLAPPNAMGTADAVGNMGNVMGLRPAIDPYIPPSSFLVGPSDQAEFYETPGAPVQLSVVDVGVAGYNIGVIGMWAASAVDPGSLLQGHTSRHRGNPVRRRRPGRSEEVADPGSRCPAVAHGRGWASGRVPLVGVSLQGGER